MIFKQCPICGRYMIPNMSETSGWYQCVCGYDTRTYLYTYSNHSSDFDYKEVQEVIDNAPTVDVIRSKWVEAEEIGDCCYTCLNCGFVRDAYLLDTANYCPNCGARMEDNNEL